MPNQTKLSAFVRGQPRWRIGAVVLILALAVVWLKGGGKSANKGAMFTARHGPLDISVLEGGSIQALESQEIKCEVRVGYQGTKILKIVEEGYQVTEDDVKTNKVLVELDSSELQKQIIQSEIQYQSAVASLTDAQQGYDIQLNQNISDIKAAEQKARFARMDFDKFLGDTVTQEIIDRIGLEKILAAEETSKAEETAASGTTADARAAATDAKAAATKAYETAAANAAAAAAQQAAAAAAAAGWSASRCACRSACRR